MLSGFHELAIATRVPSTFSRARRRRTLGAAARRLRRRPEHALLPLEEAEARLRPFNRRHVGVRAIPLDRIIGTDGRGSDFDRDFLPRRPDIARRWRGVERAFPDGDFPPIVAYRLGDAYFVLDGHHRVAIARRRGMRTIDAEVTELTSRWHLSADADLVELVHAEQERIFVESSGLRTESPIRFSHAAGYVELLENIQIHGYHLMLDGGRLLSRAAIAQDWYDEVYRPAIAAIEASSLPEHYPDATTADLFLHVYRRRRERVPDCGCTSLEDTVRDLAAAARRPFALGPAA